MMSWKALGLDTIQEEVTLAQSLSHYECYATRSTYVTGHYTLYKSMVHVTCCNGVSKI